MTIKKIPLPADSLAYNYLPVDYSDSFECTFISSKKITPDDVLIAFWTAWPAWVDWLFRLRGMLVRPFGLKSNIDDFVENIRQCVLYGKANEYISVPSRSDRETVMSVVDDHLTFHLSAIVQSGEGNTTTVVATSLVNFHNRLGRFYFFVISPFHHLVVRAMLKNVARRLG